MIIVCVFLFSTIRPSSFLTSGRCSSLCSPMHSNMQQLNTFAGAGQPTLVSYRILTEDDFVAVKELGNRCLPQRYHDDYWLGLVSSPDTYTTFGIFEVYQDSLIGVVSVLMDVQEYCSIEYLSEVEKSLMAGAAQVCYICTLFVAHTSRSQGMGRGLLLRCIEHIRSTVPRGSVIYLHVQASNQTAISMYSNLGFQQAGMIPGYYKDSFDASPQNGSMDALILYRRFG